MASNQKNKRPKISELPGYKPPTMKQLKVTAFFRRESAPAPEIKNKLETSIEAAPEVTICDSDEDTDECQEIFCSESLLEKRRSIVKPTSLSRKKYDAADFVEFDNFNYNDEVVTDKKSSKERRRCPFYKRIPYSTICVDAFNFAKEDSLKYYVLSHFHADHYVGLTKGFDKPIYCSPITGRLIRYKFKVAQKYIHTYELNEPFYISNIRCTFYEANHCPGAVIILFELPNLARYLHTGDFRACPEMEQIADLKQGGPIDCCFLDTTFCDKTKTFPPQEEVLTNSVSVCKYALEQNPRTLIVCGSYCIGKEKVFLAVAEALNLKVWCNESKREYFNCIQDPRLEAVLVDEQEVAGIHVLPLKSLWKRGMREYLEKQYAHFDAIVALRPSGWEYKRNKHMIPEVEGNIAIYPVPYSEHSSFTDLQRFILWLRPKRIIPTVNMGDPMKRGQMNHIFRRWQRTPYAAPLVGDNIKKLKADDDNDDDDNDHRKKEENSNLKTAIESASAASGEPSSLAICDVKHDNDNDDDNNDNNDSKSDIIRTNKIDLEMKPDIKQNIK